MKTIGKKINEIRTKKKWSQASIYPNNQSLISQIESGDIKNPNEGTLRQIAKNLEMSFDELIDGTDWNRNMTKDKKTEYAMSWADPIVTLEQSGEIKIKMKSYPRYNNSGDENKYCPKSGETMIAGCSICGRAIESSEQIYCMGCGNSIYDAFYKYFKTELESDFWHDLAINRKEQERLKQIRGNYELEKVIRGALQPEQSETGHEIHELAEWIFGPAWPGNKVPSSEIIAGLNSKDPRVRKFFLMRKYRKVFYDRVIDELKRYERIIRMVKKELDETAPTAPMGSENVPVYANEEKSNKDAQEEE